MRAGLEAAAAAAAAAEGGGGGGGGEGGREGRGGGGGGNAPEWGTTGAKQCLGSQQRQSKEKACCFLGWKAVGKPFNLAFCHSGRDLGKLTARTKENKNDRAKAFIS